MLTARTATSRQTSARPWPRAVACAALLVLGATAALDAQAPVRHQPSSAQVPGMGPYRVAQRFKLPFFSGDAEPPAARAEAEAPEAGAPSDDLELLPGPAMRRPQLPQQRIPLSGYRDDEDLQVSGRNGHVTIIVRDAPLNQVLALLAQTQGLNIVSSEDVTTRVTITLRDVRLEDALSAILSVAGYTWQRYNNIIHVTSVASASVLPPEVQGRVMHVFELNFASAADVEPVVAGLLSPVGKVFVRGISPVDNRKTQEILVVEDLPPYIDRVAQYISRIDVPPRQVVIEARVLQVDLEDELRHGIDWKLLGDDGELGIEIRGFANPAAPQAFFATVTASKFEQLIELVKTTTDGKTLASPKLLVVNGQEARIQVGEQLGFRVTTTTETASLETVNFLDVGVVLRVTPHISPTGEVLMHVKPEVSSGDVNPETGLPEEETTEVETDVLLNSGQGIIIGGLIQEVDSDRQNKIPWLGDLWLIGRLFQKRTRTKSRSEIIIGLIPHIVPPHTKGPIGPPEELDRISTPLLHGPLYRTPRPWEPRLPDAYYRPIRPLQKHAVGPHGVEVHGYDVHGYEGPVLEQPRSVYEPPLPGQPRRGEPVPEQVPPAEELPPISRLPRVEPPLPGRGTIRR